MLHETFHRMGGALNKCNMQVGGTCYICLRALCYDSYIEGGSQKGVLYITFLGGSFW